MLRISLSMSSTESALVLEWLIDAISNRQLEADAPMDLVMGNPCSASWQEITLAYDGKANQRFPLSAARRAAWLTVVQAAVTPGDLEDTA